MERVGDGQGRQRPRQGVTVALVPEQPRLEHRLGQLLDEQRHPVRLRHDTVQEFRRERLAPGDPPDHRRRLAPPESAERDRVRPARPGRDELRPEGDHDQHGQVLHPVDRQPEQLQGGRVGPVRVLQHGQDQPLRGQARELVDQGLERQPLAPLRRQGERRVASLGRDRQQVGQQRRDRPDVRG